MSNKKRFGRSIDSMIDSYQIFFMEVDGNIVFFIDAEAVCNLEKEEPEDLEPPVTKSSKAKGKHDLDMVLD